jgi:putative salt-induced outer membrane protein YdiY
MFLKLKSGAASPAFVVLFCILTVPPACADEIVLANGDRLTGKIVRKETDTLVFNTPYAGDLSIAWANIRRITTDHPVSVYIEDGNKLIGTLHSEDDGSVIVTSGETLTSNAVPIAQLRYINPSAEVSGEGAKVTGHINAGLSSSSGNTVSRRSYLDTETVARTRDNRYTLGGRASRAADHGIESESYWIAYMKYDHFLTKKWYAYANGNFENDKFKDIRLRSTLGLGSGYQFVESEKANLSLEGGVTYVNTDFIVAEDDSYPAARWAVKFDHLLGNSKVRFFHAHETYVSLEDVQKVFVRSQTGLRVPLFKNLNATAQYNVDWDNNPTQGRVRTDKTLLLTLGYNW